jgi:Ser-tRNA(Ala) deacylase AlaX
MADDSTVRIFSTTDRAEVEKVCGYMPDYIEPNEAIRLVVMAEPFGRPCMGTHVSHLKQIGRVAIRSMRVRKGETSIGYDVEQ